MPRNYKKALEKLKEEEEEKVCYHLLHNKLLMSKLLIRFTRLALYTDCSASARLCPLYCCASARLYSLFFCLTLVTNVDQQRFVDVDAGLPQVIKSY